MASEDYRHTAMGYATAAIHCAKDIENWTVHYQIAKASRNTTRASECAGAIEAITSFRAKMEAYAAEFERMAQRTRGHA